MTNTFWIALVILFFTGMSLVAGPICIQTLVQTSVANEFRARVIALSGVIVISGPAIGAVVVGWIGDQVGIQTPVLGSALIALLIWLLMSRTTNAAASQLEKA